MGRLTKLLLGLVLVAAFASGAFWWFVLRGDAPPEARLRDRSDETAAATTAAASADGEWQVAPGEEVFVGYRTMELFGGNTIKNEAAGRTPVVSGTMRVAGDEVEAAEFAADLSQLASDKERRDRAVRDRILETAQFPEATFVLTTPIDLGGVLAVGEEIAVDAAGDLTIHGVTKPVEIPLDARWNGDTIDVAGSLPVVFADWDIDAVNIAGMVQVDDHGTMELQLTYERA